jgi:GT2 family glycosyltransferase
VLASVIIVSYNGKDQVRACLASVLATLPANCEVIVVDNASVDGSPDMVAGSFPSVRLIRSETNTGFGCANNLGVTHAKGEFVVFVNPDTVAKAGWLDPLLTMLQQDANAGLVTGKLLRPDSRINTCGNDIHLTGLTLCRGLGDESIAYNRVEEVNAISGALFATRRQLFEHIGGFDEAMFLYMEDTDLSWRIRLAGWRCLFTPASVVVHDYELRFAPLKVFYQERNRYLMLLKNLRSATWLVLLPSLLLAEVVTWGFVFTRDRRNWRNKLRAYVWVIRHWSMVMDKRRRAQTQRKIRDRDLIARTIWQLDFGQVSQGVAGQLATVVFNPLFGLFWLITRGVVWW